MDTTARAILRMKKGESPDEQSLNAALKSVKCSVKTLEKTKVPLVAETIDITIEGLG